eukprot:4807516-Alexandrium_andersonii.AAC.1
MHRGRAQNAPEGQIDLLRGCDPDPEGADLAHGADPMEGSRRGPLPPFRADARMRMKAVVDARERRGRACRGLLGHSRPAGRSTHSGQQAPAERGPKSGFQDHVEWGGQPQGHSDPRPS